jgi:formate dehydrogenase subunit delta
MKIDALLKMANEIAAFFAGESGPEEAPRLVATHLRRYWEPRMRREIIAHYERGGAGLDECARNAVALLAAESAQGTPAGGAG